MMFWLLNNRFTFYEFDGFVFLPLHIYRRYLSPPVRKMCPISNLPLIGKNIIIFSNKTFESLIWKKYTLINLIFVKYLEPRKELILIFYNCLHMNSGKSQCLSYWFNVHTALLRMSGVIHFYLRRQRRKQVQECSHSVRLSVRPKILSSQLL